MCSWDSRSGVWILRMREREGFCDVGSVVKEGCEERSWARRVVERTASVDM